MGPLVAFGPGMFCIVGLEKTDKPGRKYWPSHPCIVGIYLNFSLDCPLDHLHLRDITLVACL